MHVTRDGCGIVHILLAFGIGHVAGLVNFGVVDIISQTESSGSCAVIT